MVIRKLCQFIKRRGPFLFCDATDDFEKGKIIFQILVYLCI